MSLKGLRLTRPELFIDSESALTANSCPNSNSEVQTMRRMSVVLIALTGTLALAAPKARASCSNGSLHGNYGLHATGTINGVGDFAAVGRFRFDGDGHLTAKLFFRIAGNNGVAPSITGTYTVHPDCTVSDQWGGSTHVSVIVDGGNGYLILNNTVGEGDTISGEARRLSPEDTD